MMDKHDGTAMDSLVRSIYRDVAREHTPAGLDKAVLDIAGHAAAAAGRSRRRAWMSPLALAASIGLCLAIVLQVTGVPDPGPDRAAQPAPSPEAMHEAAVESREQKMGEAYRDKSAIPQDFAGSDAAAELTGPGEASAQATRTAPAAFDSRDDAGACDDAERAGPDAWLDCIESLEAGGHAADAASERRRLEQAHPGFTPFRE
jgi:hypothetical protein